MKNLLLQNLFLIGLVFSTQAIKSGPHCWDYQEKRWLRRGPFTPVKDCPCNCAQQYQSTDFDKRGRKCTACNHKQVISFDPTTQQSKPISKRSQQLQSFEKKSKNRIL